jgi:hypothetical protein
MTKWKKGKRQVMVAKILQAKLQIGSSLNAINIFTKYGIIYWKFIWKCNIKLSYIWAKVAKYVDICPLYQYECLLYFFLNTINVIDNNISTSILSGNDLIGCKWIFRDFCPNMELFIESSSESVILNCPIYGQKSRNIHLQCRYII